MDDSMAPLVNHIKHVVLTIIIYHINHLPAIMDDSTAAFAANSAPVFVLCDVVARHMAVAAAEIAWAAAELLAAASAATRDAYLKILKY